MPNLREVTLSSLTPSQDNSEVLEAIKTLAKAIKPSDNTEVVKLLASLIQAMPGEISKIEQKAPSVVMNLEAVATAIKEKEIQSKANTYIFDIIRDGHGRVKSVVARPE